MRPRTLTEDLAAPEDRQVEIYEDRMTSLEQIHDQREDEAAKQARGEPVPRRRPVHDPVARPFDDGTSGGVPPSKYPDSDYDW